MASKRILALILSVALVVSLDCVFLTPRAQCEAETAVFLNPSYQIVDCGGYFQINISIRGVTDLGGWQVKIRYDVGFFEAVNISCPSDNVFEGREYGIPDSRIENSLGYVLCGAALLGDQPSFNGSGTLATIEFAAKIRGNWTLTVDKSDTMLLDNNVNTIPFIERDADVLVQPYPLPTTTISLSPNLTVLDSPFVYERQTFRAYVNVSNVYGLNAWQVRMLFDSSILECLSDGTNNALGYVQWSSFFSGAEYVSGDYVVGSVWFRARSLGNSSLSIDERNTFLWMPNRAKMAYVCHSEARVEVRSYLLFDIDYSYSVRYPIPPSPQGLFLYPNCVNASEGSSFNLTIRSNIIGYYFEAWLLYNSSILQVSRCFAPYGDWWSWSIHNSEGYTYICSPMGGAGVDIEFTVVDDGKSVISFGRGSYIGDCEGNAVVWGGSPAYFNLLAFDRRDFLHTVNINVSRHQGSYENVSVCQSRLCSNSKIMNLSVDPVQRRLKYDTAPLPYLSALENDYANLTLPKDIFDGRIEILADGASLDFSRQENSTHVFLFFEYSHQPHSFTIQAVNEYYFNVTKNGQTYSICAMTNSTISDFRFDEETDSIVFNVTGLSGTSGFCKLALPHDLMNPTMAVWINDIPSRYNFTMSSGSLCLTMMYGHSRDRIQIRPTVEGDVNGDLRVDLRDVYAVAQAYGSVRNSPRWDQLCDINKDNKVDLKDYFTTCKNYGKSW